MSHQGKITRLRDTDGDNRADEQELLVSDLPFDLHQNDNLKFGHLINDAIYRISYGAS